MATADAGESSGSGGADVFSKFMSEVRLSDEALATVLVGAKSSYSSLFTPHSGTLSFLSFNIILLNTTPPSLFFQVKTIEKRDSVLTGAQQINRLLRPGSKYSNLNPYNVRK